MSGGIVAQGEAFEFGWFDAAALDGTPIGFDQERVIASCLKGL